LRTAGRNYQTYAARRPSILVGLRLIICEELPDEAPGIAYHARKLRDLKLEDPWKTDPEYEIPPIELRLVYVKEEQSGSLIEGWNIKRAA
jgi:hypothetical protein